MHIKAKPLKRSFTIVDVGPARSRENPIIMLLNSSEHKVVNQMISNVILTNLQPSFNWQ